MLDLAMRPAGDTRDLADLAASGPDAEPMGNFVAFGLPDSKFPVVRVTPDVAEALRLKAEMAPFFGEEAELGVARGDAFDHGPTD